MDGSFGAERPWLNGDKLTFIGTPVSDRILLQKSLTSGVVSHLVDTTTPVPGSGVNFDSFGEFCATSNHVAFVGHSSAGEGVYLLPSGAPSVVKIAQVGEPVPSITNRTFGSFLNVAIADGSPGASGWFLAGDNFGAKLLCKFSYDGSTENVQLLVYEPNPTPEGELTQLQLPQTGFDGDMGVFVAQPQSASTRVLFGIGPAGNLLPPGAEVRVTAQYQEIGPVVVNEIGDIEAQAAVAAAYTNSTDPLSVSMAEAHAYLDSIFNSPVCKARAVSSGIDRTNTDLGYSTKADSFASVQAWFRPVGTDPGTNITVNVALSIGGFLDSACYTRSCSTAGGHCFTNDSAGAAGVTVTAVLRKATTNTTLFYGGVFLGKSVDTASNTILLESRDDWPNPTISPGNFQPAPSGFGSLPGSLTQSNELSGDMELSEPIAQAWRVAVNRLFTNAVSVGFNEVFGLELGLLAVADAANISYGACARSDFFNTVGGAVSTDIPGVHFVLVDENGNPIQPASTFAEWQARKFSPGQLADPAYSGETADPDHDGMPNLLEYACYHEPRIPDFIPIPKGFVTNGVLAMSFPRNRAATDLTFVPEVSETLTGPWQSGSAAIIETTEDPNPASPTFNVLARDQTATNAPARFGRVKVIRN